MDTVNNSIGMVCADLHVVQYGLHMDTVKIWHVLIVYSVHCYTVLLLTVYAIKKKKIAGIHLWVNQLINSLLWKRATALKHLS